jgi:hypothetical protein
MIIHDYDMHELLRWRYNMEPDPTLPEATGKWQIT